jgi:hypothetical protein
MDNLSRGYRGNRVVGTYYSSAQYNALAHQDFVEMETLAIGMQDGTENDEEEF